MADLVDTSFEATFVKKKKVWDKNAFQNLALFEWPNCHRVNVNVYMKTFIH